MAVLQAFRALRFDPQKVRDLGKVVAPPYDIISEREQDYYYALHPHNVIRLDYGKAQAGDSAKANKYTRAAKLLELWTAQGVLKRDAQPALYLAAQDYQGPDKKKRTFAGVYAALKLEDYKKGVVRPHEKTLSKPKADRLELTKATRVNFSPIFFLYDDPKAKGAKWMAAQMKKKPAFDFKTPSGERHRLWLVQGAAVKAYTQALAKSAIYIADGHHRYETMLVYSKSSKAASAKLTMACLTPFQSPGLMILPTHRLVHGLKGFQADRLIQALARDFEVRPQAGLDQLQQAMAKAGAKGSSRHVFGLVLAHGAHYYSLSLRLSLDPVQLLPGKRSPAYKQLDVAILQALVLEKVLGMTSDSIAAQEGIRFEKGADKSAKQALAGLAQAAFLVNATRMDQLKAVSDAKDVMPQKSTYFQPKLITGAVLRPLA